MNERLLIFDIDGTLCDTNEVDDECFLGAAGELLGLAPQSLDWRAAPHVTDAGIARYLWETHRGRPPGAAEVASFLDRFVAVLEGEIRRAPARFSAVAGAATLIERLGPAGWDMAIATGGWGRSARLKLAAAGLPDRCLLASSDDSADRVEIFRLAHRRAMEERGAGYLRTVLAGDGLWDLQVAQALGWPLIGVARGEKAELLRQGGAAVVIEDFRDAERFLEMLDLL
ncbi:MAG TPA: HAD family hydrolase [Thermoanaerobaculia bacterium]|jgi:phosphoglycolate phosphatase-like HAD superfamily hydrolase